jgi:hypothetical protein
LHQKLHQFYLIVSMNKLCLLFITLLFGVSQNVVKANVVEALPLCPKNISEKLYSKHGLTSPPFKLSNTDLKYWEQKGKVISCVQINLQFIIWSALRPFFWQRFMNIEQEFAHSSQQL